MSDASSSSDAPKPVVPRPVMADERRLEADPHGRLSVESITAALTDMNQVLADSGKHLQIGIVGGAALALAHRARASTHDVDVWTNLPAVMRMAAAAVAQKRNLPTDWMCDEASRFLPQSPTRFAPWTSDTNLTVMVARPQVLLAMKMEAGRRKDVPDIRFLARALSLTTCEQALTIHQTLYRRPLNPETEVQFRDAFAHGF